VAARIRGTTELITTDLTVDLGDIEKTILGDASSADITVNLPAISGLAKGFRLNVKKTDSSSNAVTLDAAGSETIDGAATLSLSNQYAAASVVADGSDWQVYSEFGSSASSPYMRGYISGMLPSNDTDTDHDISFSIGKCRDSTDAGNMSLSSALVKQIDSDWVVGTGNGGFPSGLSIAIDTWYHLFIIAKTDGTTDAGFDSSITATNLLTDATGYTLYRRVGSVRTDATSNILKFFAVDKGISYREFLWYFVPNADGTAEISDLTTGATANTGTLTHVPTGITVFALLYASLDRSHTGLTEDRILLYVSALENNDQAAGLHICQIGIGLPGSGTLTAAALIEVKTNTSAAFRYRTSFTGIFTCSSKGWIDPL